MKTLNNAVVSFVSSNTTVQPTIQAYFNGMLEGLTSDQVLIGSYYDTLTSQGKMMFNTIFTEVSEEVVSISKVIKYRSVKLRKQISAVAKRHSKKKVERSEKGIFIISKETLFSKMEFEASLLLRRIGVIPTDSPILELMSIPVTEAGFIFNTEGLCNSLKAVLNMAAKVLAA